MTGRSGSDLWWTDVNEVLTLSEHNRRAHYRARINWRCAQDKEKREGIKAKPYRWYFARAMSISMLYNYCFESMSRDEREKIDEGKYIGNNCSEVA